MASSIMNMGHLPRRRPSLDAVSTAERAIAAGLLVTLTASAALVFIAGRSPNDAAEISVLSAAPVVADPAPSAAASFVESGDTAADAVQANAAVTAETNTVEAGTMLGGFEIAAGDIQALYITVGFEPVNMRVEPGVTASIVSQIEPGDAAMALSSGRTAINGTDEWMEVEYLGATGWVRSDLLQRTDAN